MSEEATGLSYMQETSTTLVAVFGGATVLGIAFGYAMLPEGVPLWKGFVGGGLFGFHAALYPYANRYLAMPD